MSGPTVEGTIDVKIVIDFPLIFPTASYHLSILFLVRRFGIPVEGCYVARGTGKGQTHCCSNNSMEILEVDLCEIVGVIFDCIGAITFADM